MVEVIGMAVCKLYISAAVAAFIVLQQFSFVSVGVAQLREDYDTIRHNTVFPLIEAGSHIHAGSLIQAGV